MESQKMKTKVRRNYPSAVDRTKHPEVDLCSHDELINKGVRVPHWGQNNSFKKWCCNKLSHAKE